MDRGSEPFDPRNLLDRVTAESAREAFYRRSMARERLLLARRLGIPQGDVLSVGAGWHPGRHLFPAPAYRLVAVDADPERVAGVLASRRADSAIVGYAGELEFSPGSFDVVLHRLVLTIWPSAARSIATCSRPRHCCGPGAR